MIRGRDLRALLGWTVAGLSVLDIVAAVILSGYAVALTSGAVPTGHPHGGAGASAGVLAMTLPVAWRRWPQPACWPPPASTGSCSARWSAAAPPCPPSCWWPSRRRQIRPGQVGRRAAALRGHGDRRGPLRGP